MSSPSAPPSENLHDQIESAGAPDSPSGRAPLVSIDLTEGGPPPELLDQMARADEINMRLRRSGREICFALSGDGRSLQIELRDSEGRVLRFLSLAEATDLAEGRRLPD